MKFRAKSRCETPQAGQTQDSYIKLIYLRSRFYSPEAGRFQTRDTWQGDYNRPGSLNKWNYTEANPINLTDPTGYSSQPSCSVCDMWKKLMDWYTGEDVGYTGSGWGHGPRQLIGHGLGLDLYAENLPDLVILSLLQYDSVTLTGAAIEKIKKDPEMQAYEKDIINITKNTCTRGNPKKTTGYTCVQFCQPNY